MRKNNNIFAIIEFCNSQSLIELPDYLIKDVDKLLYNTDLGEVIATVETFEFWNGNKASELSKECSLLELCKLMDDWEKCKYRIQDLDYNKLKFCSKKLFVFLANEMMNNSEGFCLKRKQIEAIKTLIDQVNKIYDELMIKDIIE
jgi:hypothetical protein